MSQQELLQCIPIFQEYGNKIKDCEGEKKYWSWQHVQTPKIHNSN